MVGVEDGSGDWKAVGTELDEVEEEDADVVVVVVVMDVADEEVEERASAMNSRMSVLNAVGVSSSLPCPDVALGRINLPDEK